MGWIEYLIIIAGVSLDLFAAMECEGSLVSKVNKIQLGIICIFLAMWQVVLVFVGHISSSYLYSIRPSVDESSVGEILSVIIFTMLGLRLIVKAVRNEIIQERLVKDLKYVRFVAMALSNTIYTLLIGIVFGFLGTNLVDVLVIVALETVFFIAAGMYTGYHYGFEQKRKAYIAGALFMWAAGIDVFVKFVG